VQICSKIIICISVFASRRGNQLIIAAETKSCAVTFRRVGSFRSTYGVCGYP